MPGRIGCKSIEIDAGQMPLTGNVISMDYYSNRSPTQLVTELVPAFSIN